MTVKNVIFQYCQSGFYASTQYRNINVQTPECGYYMTEGKAIPVTWEKDGEFGVTHYYDADHREIVLNQGKTWVCIIPTGDFKKDSAAVSSRSLIQAGDGQRNGAEKTDENKQ